MMWMRIRWWKWLTALLLVYSVLAGFLVPVPQMATGNLAQTARNLYFHVPMWFGMTILLLLSVIFSIRYLRSRVLRFSILAETTAEIGVWFGVLGVITGALWANYTWGSPWHGDPKQNAAAIALLIYLAYFILKGALDNQEQAARIAAVYNVFAFAAFIPLIYILPRLTDSLHPGNGGNPGFNQYDLDGNMRLVFYPAVIGWILMGWWLASLRARVKIIKEKSLEQSAARKVSVIETR